MAFEPFPCDLVAASLCVKLPPEVGVLHGLACCGDPSSRLPTVYPIGNSLPEILGICVDAHLAGLLERREPLDPGPDFHAVVCRCRLAAGNLFRVLPVSKYGSPSAWTGISVAPAVCKNDDLFQAGQSFKSAGDPATRFALKV